MPSEAPAPKTPAKAVEAVIAWHTKGATGLSTSEIGRTAVNFHSALLGIVDAAEDPARVGLRRLLSSLAEYAAAHGVEFDVLAMKVEAHAAIYGPRRYMFASIKDDGRPADAGVWHLLLTLRDYAEGNGVGFTEMILEVMNPPNVSFSIGFSS